MVPLNAIRAFVLAARSLSFTDAALQLSVTSGAVSQQVARLEAYLGVQLFERAGRRLTLTTDGRRLYIAIASSVDRIDVAASALRASPHHEPITVATLASLAAKWLAPRLQRFHASCPAVRLQLITGTEPIDLKRAGVDVAIRFGSGRWPELASRRLFTEVLFPVASPSFVAGVDLSAGPQVLKSLPLFADVNGPTEWTEWFAAAGLPIDNVVPALSFNDSLVALAALSEGVDGVMLARGASVHDDVREGRLSRLFDVHIPAQGAFYLSTRPDVPPTPALEAFRDWLLAEAELYRTMAFGGGVVE